MVNEYVDAFVEAYRKAPPFPTIVINHLGRDWSLSFSQHARILFWDFKEPLPIFVPEAPATIEQYWYHCAATGKSIPRLADVPVGDDTLRYPITNVTPSDVAEFYNWLNEWYGFTPPYKVEEGKIEMVNDGIGFKIPNEVEQKWILEGLRELSINKLSQFCWHQYNSKGKIQPVKTEQRRYFNKYQIGTLFPDGEFAPRSIGMCGPAGNVYWMAFDRKSSGAN